MIISITPRGSTLLSLHFGAFSDHIFFPGFLIHPCPLTHVFVFVICCRLSIVAIISLAYSTHTSILLLGFPFHLPSAVISLHHSFIYPFPFLVVNHSFL